jgi:hypothetical protein
MTDFLTRDQPIPGVTYGIVSFLSPEKVIAQRHLFDFARFRRQYVIDTRLKCVETFCEFLSKKHGLDISDIMKDFGMFARHHEQTPEFSYGDAEDAWETFLLKHEKTLKEEFDEAHAFQTHVRGFKLRDVAENMIEAQAKAKRFAEMDGHKFNVSIVQVGGWAPWDPEMRDIKDVVYAEEQLNELHQAYEVNKAKREQMWREDVEQRKKAILQENIERKRNNELQLEKERAEAQKLAEA